VTQKFEKGEKERLADVVRSSLKIMDWVVGIGNDFWTCFLCTIELII
jgi:hypothetical protein